MRRFLPNAFVLVITLALTATGPALAKPPPGVPTHVPGQLIVGFSPGASGQARAAAHAAAGAHVIRNLDSIGAQLVSVPEHALAARQAIYNGNPNVRFVEPNFRRFAVLPNEGSDPPPPNGLGFDYMTEQWGLNNTGQPIYYDEATLQHGAIVGTVDADINAPTAWDLSTGDASITVAVLDTGVACLHVDLSGKCVDQANFTVDTQEDEFGHGTHVAGIAAANTNNGVGIAGVGWASTLADIKVCHKEYVPALFAYLGVCDTADIVNGLAYATNMGFEVINMSFSGPDLSQAEANAVAAAWSGGAVLVAAAGNGYSPNLAYPAAFPEVIGVGSFDWHGNLSAFSNFGNWVSVAAPGDHIFSTYPDSACGIPEGDPEGCYTWLSGTSMSSPHVAGLAALLFWHIGPTATNAGVRSAIESNARPTGPIGQNFAAWTQHGMIDMTAALANNQPPPGPGIHFGDLDGSSAKAGKNWSATVVITVHDENEMPVSGVPVDGSWSLPTGAVSMCITNGNGTCSMSSGNIANRDGSSTVLTVTTTDSSYQPAANHDPDGDSNGDSITVNK